MRVRFAPSPTGQLHIGGARTALYNWLLARGSGGTLLLRIEDTDRERSTPENVEHILDALGWLGLDFDEGPVFQTAREERHRAVVQRLLDEDLAYRSTATGDDVKAYKALHGDDRGFRGAPEDEGAVRLRVPDDGETVIRDVIRGDTTFRHVHLDDPVIARADGSPLYNLAVAVDDLDAGITHVVRGEDHISNTPKQVLVLEALGEQAPLYAHLPLLHGPDGKKLSKRHGAASVQDLRAAGYLPEAIRNYLALLGWGDADDETIIPTDELIRRFALERVSKNPARFDEQKLRWMNGRYLRELGTDELTSRLEAFTGRDGAARRRGDQRGEDPDARGLLAARRASSSTGLPTTPRRARSGSGRRAAALWERFARRSAPSRTGTCRASTRRCTASSRRARPSRATSSSRSASRSRAPRSRRASSRRSRCWDVRSRCAASTRAFRRRRPAGGRARAGFRRNRSNSRPGLPIGGGSPPGATSLPPFPNGSTR